MEKAPDQTAKMAAFTLPPIDPEDLETPDRREAALDALAVWFVDALLASEGDYDTASALIRIAIGTFYDVREAGGVPRSDAGRYFMVDGVGIGPTRRAVPWSELAERAPPSHHEIYRGLFDELVADVR